MNEVEPDVFPFTFGFASGSKITVEAVPSFGYMFTGWGGHLSGTENPAFIVMDCPKNVTAGFAVDMRVVGTASGGILLAIILVVVLIMRRKSPARTARRKRR